VNKGEQMLTLLVGKKFKKATFFGSFAFYQTLSNYRTQIEFLFVRGIGPHLANRCGGILLSFTFTRLGLSHQLIQFLAGFPFVMASAFFAINNDDMSLVPLETPGP
jgi:hypothetical protein